MCEHDSHMGMLSWRMLSHHQHRHSCHNFWFGSDNNVYNSVPFGRKIYLEWVVIFIYWSCVMGCGVAPSMACTRNCDAIDTHYTIHVHRASLSFGRWGQTRQQLFALHQECFTLIFHVGLCSIYVLWDVVWALVLRSKAHIRTRELSNGSSVTKVRDDGAGRSGAQTVRCYCLLSTEMEQGSRTEHTAITQNTHHIRVHIMLA